MRRTRTKICCISSLAEAQLAISFGADALGLVGDMPTGPGIISDEKAQSIITNTGPAVATFLLTSETTSSGIIAHAHKCRPSTMQIVKHIDPSEYSVVHEGLPGVKLVQVLHVEDGAIIDIMKTYEPLVDGFLLDSGRPSIDEFGGTGRTHNWDISAQLVQKASKPVFLAGGLSPDNIFDAILQVRPYGVDICSSLRKNNKLDETLISRYYEEIARADKILYNRNSDE